MSTCHDLTFRQKVSLHVEIRICQGEPVSKPGGISDMLRRSRDQLESLNHLKRCPEARQICSKRNNMDIDIDW